MLLPLLPPAATSPHPATRIRLLFSAVVIGVLATALLQAGDAPGPAPAPTPILPGEVTVTPNPTAPYTPPKGTLTLTQALDLGDNLNETREVARARLEEALAPRKQAPRKSARTSRAPCKLQKRKSEPKKLQ